MILDLAHLQGMCYAKWTCLDIFHLSSYEEVELFMEAVEPKFIKPE
jgi:hypothetical protein